MVFCEETNNLVRPQRIITVAAVPITPNVL